MSRRGSAVAEPALRGDNWRRLLALAAGSAAAGLAIGVTARALVPVAGRPLRLVNGREVQVLDRGSGPAVVMIHGLGGQMQNFARVIPLLQDYRVIAIDRAGAGRSQPAAPGESTLAMQAALVAEVMEARGVGSAVIVGHSLGGAVALQLAADRPDLVSGVVTIGALTRPVHPRLAAVGRAVGAAPPLREAMAHLATAPSLPFAAPWFLRLIFAPESMPRDFLTHDGGLLAVQPRAVSGVMRDLDVVARGIGALQTRLPHLAMPVTALHATGDRVLGPGEARHLKSRVPQTRLWLTPGGHMLPVTQPTLVARAIREILSD